MGVSTLTKKDILIKKFYLAFWTSQNPPSASLDCWCNGWSSAAILDHEVNLGFKANLEEGRGKKKKKTEQEAPKLVFSGFLHIKEIDSYVL